HRTRCDGAPAGQNAHRRDQRGRDRHRAAPARGFRSGARRHQPSEKGGADLEKGTFCRRRSLGRGRMGPGAAHGSDSGRCRGKQRMKRLWLIAAIAAATLAAQDYTFKTSVNLVRVVASVKNKAGELVGTLKADDFEIYDNGAKQEIAVFSR